jgi:diguanylate cyclase (GGDEF)-like protein
VLHRASIYALVLLFLGVLLYLDTVSGPYPSLRLLYLVPVLLAVWFLDARTAYAAALLAGVAGFAFAQRALPTSGSNPSPGWDALAAMAFLLGFAYLALRLRQALCEARHMSQTDALTGAASRWYFEEMAAREHEKSLRYRRPLTIAYIDIDKFKSINDRYGHGTGDKLLALVARTIRHELRRGDLLGRLGGDEFAVLLVESGVEESRASIARMRKSLSEAASAAGLPVTVSIGSATSSPESPQPLAALIRSADHIMYSIKHARRMQHAPVVPPQTRLR